MDIAFLLPWVLATAALSAVFGMAGGMVLLLVLTARMPLPEAMVLHGVLQLVANGSRMLISARHVRLDIVLRFGAAGVLTALAILAVASVSGTWLGRQALDRLTETSFRGATRAIVCAVGALSLARGLLL